MKQVLRPTLTAAALIAVLGVVGAGAALGQTRSSTANTNTTVDKSKASYVVGMQLADQYPVWARDMIDPNIVGQAVTATLKGQKPTMTQTEAQSTAQAFGTQLRARGEQMMAKLGAQNKQEGAVFLAKNKSQPGVKTTADGLQYQVLKQGSGPRPIANDTIQIEYTGSFTNGNVFDATSKHSPPGPATISLDKVFPGFREGLMLMPVGSHYKLVIPSDLAYGAEPKVPDMPPNATLVFDVTLVKIGK